MTYDLREAAERAILQLEEKAEINAPICIRGRQRVRRAVQEEARRHDADLVVIRTRARYTKRSAVCAPTPTGIEIRQSPCPVLSV